MDFDAVRLGNEIVYRKAQVMDDGRIKFGARTEGHNGANRERSASKHEIWEGRVERRDPDAESIKPQQGRPMPAFIAEHLSLTGVAS